PLPSPLLWPPPPAPARIAYIGRIAASSDLKPARDALQGLGEALFGKKDESAVVSPFAMCTDGGERLFVADPGAQMVHVFDMGTRKYAQWKPAPPEQFTQPVGLAWDPAGRLLVCDSVGEAIFVFAADGTYKGKLGVGVLQRPAGIAREPATGRFFVADVYAHQVVVLSPEGELVRRIGERGAGMGQFNYPTNLAFDSKGRLYVSDSLNFRVQQFLPSPDLRFNRYIGRQGDVPGTFSQPKGIAVDSEDHVYVVDSRFENIQIFDDQGQLLLFLGEEGAGPGQFWLPAGAFIDARNRIWVADTYNGRVQVFQYLPASPEAADAEPATQPATRPALPENWAPSKGGPVPVPTTIPTEEKTP
ncbi:MAG: 6-bladed beta-propeller, partial [Tepidisphaeraceae bacterium]